MVNLYFAKVSVVHYKDGTADIMIPELEQQIINDVPYIAKTYEMPKVGDTVAAVLDLDGGDKGVLLGPVYNGSNKPEEYGKDLFVKKFKDGTKIIYDSTSKKMDISIETITVKNIKADGITYKKIGQE